MSSNVFIFHGTEGYPEENWFPWLKGELESKGCQVIIPDFPSPPAIPAKIDEWLEVMSSYDEMLNDEAIIIGHSLGGIFALRKLEKLDHLIKAAFFVGTPIGIQPIKFYDRDNSFSGFDFDWDKIRISARYFRVFHSDNDPYVDIENGRKLAENLGVELTVVPNAGHFNTDAGYTKFELLRDRVYEVL